jgi:flagellar biogenesis protein FliO
MERDGHVTSQSLRLLRTLATLWLATLSIALIPEKAVAAPAPLPETAAPAPLTPAATPERTGTAATPATPERTGTAAATAPALPLGRPDQPLRLGATNAAGSGSLIWQSLAAILVVLVLGGVALYVVKRLRPRIAQARGKKMRLLETFHLGQQKALFLMEVGNQRLLLGVSRDSLRLVADVTAAVPPSPEGEGTAKAKFVLPSLDAESGQRAES